VSLLKERHVSGLIFVPLLAMKLALVAVAAAYWHPEACALLKPYSGRWLYIPAVFAYFEASLMWQVISSELEQMRASRFFYPALLAQVAVTVVLPVALLLVAVRMVGLNQCAAA
jgi:hypothetical protein